MKNRNGRKSAKQNLLRRPQSMTIDTKRKGGKFMRKIQSRDTTTFYSSSSRLHLIICNKDLDILFQWPKEPTSVIHISAKNAQSLRIPNLTPISHSAANVVKVEQTTFFSPTFCTIAVPLSLLIESYSQ